MGKQTFALYFGNRGFMPGELIESARADMIKAVTDAGYDYIAMDPSLTRYGAIETRDEGLLYAKWLKQHQGEFDGVILCMPIFVDENGALNALRDANVPILLQAYPDEIGKMGPKWRRDAYCGKFSVSDCFCQEGIPFTVLKPHVVHPLTKQFKANLHEFAGICRVVKGMRRFNIGCIGARVTAFKTVRFDEITLAKKGINVESFDFSELIEKVRNLKDDDEKVLTKIKSLEDYVDFGKVPTEKKYMIAKVGKVIDDYIEEYHLDAIAFRCWNEMETYLRVTPCMLLSELNDRGIAASCELDVCSAITMRALWLASESPAACLDWNNNYGDDEDKVILFHCGSTARKLMKARGTASFHVMFEKGDPGSGWGTIQGSIAKFPMTCSDCSTVDGKIKIYVTEGEFTDDELEPSYFGCAGVAKIPNLENKLIKLAKGGFKHHCTVTNGHVKSILEEAFTTYLGYDVVDIEG